MLSQLTTKLKDLAQRYKGILVEKNAQFSLAANADFYFDWTQFYKKYNDYQSTIAEYQKQYMTIIRPCIDSHVVTDAIAAEAAAIIASWRDNTKLLTEYIQNNLAHLKKVMATQASNDSQFAKKIINALPELQQQLAQGGRFDGFANDVKEAQQKTNERYKESPLLTDPDTVNAGTPAVSSFLDAFASGKTPNKENDDYNDPELNVGDNGKYHYQNFNELPLTDANGINEDDVEQGSLGDCYALSSLSALARDKDAKDILLKNITKVKENLYEVTVYVKDVDKEGNQLGRIAKKVRVDTDFPVDKEGKLAYAQARNQELWVVILEKAYAKAMGGYDNIYAGKGSEALAAFTGEEATVAYTSTLELAGIVSLVPKLKIAIFQSRGVDDKKIWELKNGQKIYQAHAYSFQSYDATSKKIKLRNPHGQEHLTVSAEEVLKYFVSISSISLAKK